MVVDVRPKPYRVDSEAGRFEFETHEVKGENDAVVYVSTELFPAQRGKEHYLTRGMRELGILKGATQTSYRKTDDRLNRQRRQEQGGTPLNTLRDTTEAEGKQVLAFWDAKTAEVLKQYGVDESPATASLCKNATGLKQHSLLNQAEVKQVIDSVEIPQQLVDEVLANPVPYEDADKSVNICVDGVVTKKQSENRRNASGKSDSPNEHQAKVNKHQSDTTGRPKVKRHNLKTATIEHAKKRYALVGQTYVNLFRTILAFVLNNGFHNLRLCFFTDGELSLGNALIKAFSWHPAIAVILDWHHTEKKCGELLSMAIKGKDLRNEHWAQVTKLLWYGATQSAITYLKQIAQEQIKSMQYLDKLCAYLDKRRTMIPCYAIRKELGLRNSSNPVEKANDQLVSSRQKHQGMSWSLDGSLTLAALSAVVKNGHVKPWLQGKVLPFSMDPSSDEAQGDNLKRVA